MKLARETSSTNGRKIPIRRCAFGATQPWLRRYFGPREPIRENPLNTNCGLAIPTFGLQTAGDTFLVRPRFLFPKSENSACGIRGRQQVWDRAQEKQQWWLN